MARSRVVWAGVGAAGALVVAGLGLWFVKLGLDDADKAASVVGVFVALAGLGLSGWSAVLARRALTASAQTPGRVSASGDGSIAGAGSVRNVSTKATRPPAGGSPAPTAQDGLESVSASGLGAVASGGEIDGAHTEVTDDNETVL